MSETLGLGLGIHLGDSNSVRAAITTKTAADATTLAAALRTMLSAALADPLIHSTPAGTILDRVSIATRDTLVYADIDVTFEEATKLFLYYQSYERIRPVNGAENGTGAH